MSEGPKIEGYWYSTHTPMYPKPEPNVLSQKEAEEIYALIVRKERDENTKERCYRGFSTSRITGEALGSCEYVTDEWIWPDSFAEHYVLRHRVKPSIEFLHYIGYIDHKMDYKALYEEMSDRIQSIREFCLSRVNFELQAAVSEGEIDLAKAILKRTMGVNQKTSKKYKKPLDT